MPFQMPSTLQSPPCRLERELFVFDLSCSLVVFFGALSSSQNLISYLCSMAISFVVLPDILGPWILLTLRLIPSCHRLALFHLTLFYSICRHLHQSLSILQRDCCLPPFPLTCS